jgi:hypothetical protein
MRDCARALLEPSLVYNEALFRLAKPMVGSKGQISAATSLVLRPLQNRRPLLKTYTLVLPDMLVSTNFRILLLNTEGRENSLIY